MDWLPTLVDIVGFQPERNLAYIDGISQYATLQSGTATRTEFHCGYGVTTYFQFLCQRSHPIKQLPHLDLPHIPYYISSGPLETLPLHFGMRHTEAVT